MASALESITACDDTTTWERQKNQHRFSSPVKHVTKAFVDLVKVMRVMCEIGHGCEDIRVDHEECDGHNCVLYLYFENSKKYITKLGANISQTFCVYFLNPCMILP